MLRLAKQLTLTALVLCIVLLCTGCSFGLFYNYDLDKKQKLWKYEKFATLLKTSKDGDTDVFTFETKDEPKLTFTVRMYLTKIELFPGAPLTGPVLEDSNDLYKQYYAYLRESVGPIRLNDDDLLDVADQIFKICDDTSLYLAGHGGTVSKAFELDIVTETDTYVMEFHDKERNEIIGQLYRLLHEEVPVTKGE